MAGRRYDLPAEIHRLHAETMWRRAQSASISPALQRALSVLHNETSHNRVHAPANITVPLPWDAAMARATEALKAEGFGVRTTIDVQATLRTKLDREFRKYVILGACNPVLADRALQAELEIGRLLPCNMIVYENGPAETVVAATVPLAALGVVGENPVLQAVAIEADARLRRALHSIETQMSVTNA